MRARRREGAKCVDLSKRVKEGVVIQYTPMIVTLGGAFERNERTWETSRGKTRPNRT